MNHQDGFLILNKDKGCTSHDCVKQIRKLFNKKKVGHTGTLDPEVTGTLPIAIGSATRFIQYLPHEKIYIGQIKLGISTNTDDIHGEVLKQKDWPKLSIKQLDQYLDIFRGTFQQIPPKVSSVHIKGERAYKKSLKNEDFELFPRKVNVEELKLLKWNKDKGVIDIKVKCSAGTYIRSIARDLGKSIGSEGCLLELKRISACGFHEKDSIKISELSKLKNNKNFIIPTIFALDHISTFILSNEEDIEYWRRGRAIKFNLENLIKSPTFEHNDPIKLVNNQKILLGIGLIHYKSGSIHPKLVLNAK
tara:strand:+ start:160 stop:1074 length:915 start_codon:yes stop_codon:yes gene_type:complete